MPGFEGVDKIILHRYDSGVPFTFSFPACSTSEANDGAIPNGTTISSATVTIHKERTGSNVTTQMLDGSPSVNPNSITLALKYPTTSGVGSYYIRFILTITGDIDMEFNFDRLEVKNY